MTTKRTIRIAPKNFSHFKTFEVSKEHFENFQSKKKVLMNEPFSLPTSTQLCIFHAPVKPGKEKIVHMPRRKKLPKLPDYTGIAPEHQLVQKSHPLQSLSETPLTLPELKILDAYLSRINSHEPDKRYVRFEKGELEKLLGVTKIVQEDLEKRLDNLFVAVTIRDPCKPDGFCKIGLFEKAEAVQDDNGFWQIDLMCTNSAMEYIFNVENLGYLKYRLKSVINLTSRYSYVLFLYLEDFSGRHHKKSWEVSVDELRKLLNCTAESYNEYKWFNAKILKKCWQELNEKTALRYTYEPVRKGRKVAAIRFHLETLDDVIFAEPEAQTIEEKASVDAEHRAVPGRDYGSAFLNSLGADICKDEFTVEQIGVIAAQIELVCPDDSEEEKRCYLTIAMQMLQYYDSREQDKNGKYIKNRFNYLLKILESKSSRLKSETSRQQESKASKSKKTEVYESFIYNKIDDEEDDDE